MEEHGLVLQPHQRVAVQALEDASNCNHPVVVLPCKSKIVPDETVLVICAIIPHEKDDWAEVVPIACLGAEPLGMLVEAPGRFGKKLTIVVENQRWRLGG